MKLTRQQLRQLIIEALQEDSRQKTRSYKGKEYTARADEPYAAAQAAYIVAKGKTTTSKK
jgi:hypothetical protein